MELKFSLLAGATLDPVGGSAFAAGVLSLLVVGSPLVIWWRAGGESRRDQVLLVLRLVAAVVLVMLLWRPVWVRTEVDPTPNVLTVALDQSLSMTLPNDGGATRVETQRRVAERIDAGLKERSIEGLTVQYVGYGSSVRTGTLENWLTAEPTDTRTDLAAVVADSSRSRGGLVLVGDGRRNGDPDGRRDGSSRSMTVQQSVRQLDAAGIPLYTVPLGPPQTGRVRDVAIESLPESFALFAGNEVDVRFVVRTSGVTAGDVPVELVWQTEDNQEIEIASRQLVPDQTEQSFSMSIPAKVPAAGMYRLVVRSPAMAGETLVTNNRQTAFVEVRDGGGRVLYLEGQVRLEPLFLRRSMGRFPDLDLTYQLIPSTSREDWPIDLASEIDLSKFDAILLGDLPSEALSVATWEAIAGRIERGAGLMTLGGRDAYGDGGYRQSVIADALPVDLSDRGEAMVADTDIALLPMAEHPIVAFGTREDGTDWRQRWREVAPVLGASDFGRPRALPGVKVLLSGQTPEGGAEGLPMLVIGGFGRGRVASLAFDSTWRWWRGGDQDFHRRFWRQLLLWSMDRSDQGAIAIEIETRRLTPQQSAAVTVSADSAMEVQARVVDGNGGATPLAFESSGTDRKATVGPLPPGQYRIEASGAVGNKDSETEVPPATAAVAFEVIDRQIELERVAPDLELMRQIASMTSQHGGGRFAADQIDDLIDAIERRQRQLVTPREIRSRIGDSPAAAWGLFGWFAAATLSQWVLRRRWGLP